MFLVKIEMAFLDVIIQYGQLQPNATVICRWEA